MNLYLELRNSNDRAKNMAMPTQKSSAVKNARVRRPERHQIKMEFSSLDQMLSSDDPARIVWLFVKGLDLTPLYENIQVTYDTPGRDASMPEVLVALWLQATLDSIGSARELERRCGRDTRYRWICGDEPINHHTLSDFRVQNGEFLERLLVDTVTSLIDLDLVPLETIAQDGMKVRASAGSSSFRRKPSLEELQQQAQDHVDRLRQEGENEASGQDGEKRRQAAQERAARERQARIDEALKQHQQLSEQREKRQKGDGVKTRCSTTDPDARKMKMANGGFDPAYNIQFASDADARVIVGVEATNAGTDGNELPPMLDKLRSDYDRTPKQALVDSAFATKESVTRAESSGTQVISTVPRAELLRSHGKDPHARQAKDTDEYADFRARMAEPEYQDLYKQRPSVAEFPNAFCRNHGLRQFNVRGLIKVKAVALWHAIAFNFTRMLNLKAWGV